MLRPAASLIHLDFAPVRQHARQAVGGRHAVIAGQED
jgi:hypothetical protein